MYLAPHALHNFLQLHVEEVSKLLNVFHSFLKGKEFLFSRESSNGFWKWLFFFCHAQIPVQAKAATNKTTIVVSYGTADSSS